MRRHDGNSTFEFDLFVELDETMSSIEVVVLYLNNLWYAILKRSLASSIPFMRKDLNFSNTDIGRCSSLFSILYGTFKLVGGVLTDIFPVSSVFNAGIIFGSLLNIAIPFVPNKNWIIWLWGLNGLLQGAGGPASTKLVIEYFPKHQRDVQWSNLLLVRNTRLFFIH
jgi:sugar phosphate permease